MPLTRRYLFHGHAAAIGGRIVRLGEGKQAKLIKDGGFIDLPASSLTVVGGKSQADLDLSQLKDPVAQQVVRFTAAKAISEGVYDDSKGYYAATLGERSRDSLTTTTRVKAEVLGLQVGLEGNPRMTIKTVRGGFSSQNSNASGETPVQLDPDTVFEGVTFTDAAGKNYTLVVEVEPDVYRDNDTYSKLTDAASGPGFQRKFGHTLFLSAPAAQTKTFKAAPELKRTDGGAVQGTIIKPLKWKGAEFPGSRIDPDTRHSVYVPGIGTIYFGEISIARQARRLTMVRANLGSPAGGDFAAVDVQDNGGWA